MIKCKVVNGNSLTMLTLINYIYQWKSGYVFYTRKYGDVNFMKNDYANHEYESYLSHFVPSPHKSTSTMRLRPSPRPSFTFIKKLFRGGSYSGGVLWPHFRYQRREVDVRLVGGRVWKCVTFLSSRILRIKTTDRISRESIHSIGI